MFRFGPFDIRRVRLFGIDTASILRAPTQCWTEHLYGAYEFTTIIFTNITTSLITTVIIAIAITITITMIIATISRTVVSKTDIELRPLNFTPLARHAASLETTTSYNILLQLIFLQHVLLQ